MTFRISNEESGWRGECLSPATNLYSLQRSSKGAKSIKGPQVPPGVARTQGTVKSWQQRGALNIGSGNDKGFRERKGWVPWLMFLVTESVLQEMRTSKNNIQRGKKETQFKWEEKRNWLERLICGTHWPTRFQSVVRHVLAMNWAKPWRYKENLSPPNKGLYPQESGILVGEMMCLL